jgi:hypothetical protein
MKVANFFTEMNHKFCEHNAKENFQISGRRTGSNWSRPKGHDYKREGSKAGLSLQSGWSNRLHMLCCNRMEQNHLTLDV